jgi:hypothetical protein
VSILKTHFQFAWSVFWGRGVTCQASREVFFLNDSVNQLQKKFRETKSLILWLAALLPELAVDTKPLESKIPVRTASTARSLARTFFDLGHPEKWVVENLFSQVE